MAPPDRDRQFRMNLSDKELEMLRELAEADGLTGSDYLRTMIRREHAQRMGMTIKVPGLKQEEPKMLTVQVGHMKAPKRPKPNPKK